MFEGFPCKKHSEQVGNRRRHRRGRRDSRLSAVIHDLWDRESVGVVARISNVGGQWWRAQLLEMGSERVKVGVAT